MGVKLRQLAALDPEYAKELEAFFKKNGIGEAEYLNMTIEEFVKFCEGKLGEYSKQFMEAMRKHEYKV
jgi:hypothetical protein